MDRRHVNRLRGEKTTCLPIAFAGQNTAHALQRIDLLKWLFESVASGYLTRPIFHEAMKRRREHPVYFLNLSNRARSQHRKDAANQKAYEMLRDDPLKAISVADIYLEQEDFASAETILLRSVGQGSRPVQAKVLYRLSKIYKQRGLLDAARAVAEDASRAQPQNKVYSLWAAELVTIQPPA